MFSADYFSARDRFQRAANGACEALVIDARGPRGESLSIDIAWIGDPHARRLLLITSGIHGVEGFAGSAVQCAFIAAKMQPLPGRAVVLVHALNPWGFAHLRRVNEHNVDLNRNFLDAPADYAGAPPEYGMLDPLLNPPSAPGADAFHVRAGAYVLRYGLQPLRRTIVSGQYTFERGLFFGGGRLEQSPQVFLRWIASRCAQVDRLLALDLHVGLGPFAALTLLPQQGTAAERIAVLSQALALPIVASSGRESARAYLVRGSMLSALARSLPQARIDPLTAEFGTYGGLRILYALREENRWHHYGSGALDHPAKRRLLAVFNPDSAHWRDAVIAKGMQLLARALAAI